VALPNRKGINGKHFGNKRNYSTGTGIIIIITIIIIIITVD
jgi:hypothetical protein